MRKIKYAVLGVAVIAAAALAPCAMAKKVKKNNSASQVIYTGELAKKVIGYNGTTPVTITVKDGRITSITADANKETPSYFNKAKDKVFKQFIGKTVEEAKKLDADVATGATYSSEALIKNIKAGLKEVKSSKKDGKTASKAKAKGKTKGKKRMTR